MTNSKKHSLGRYATKLFMAVGVFLVSNLFYNQILAQTPQSTTNPSDNEPKEHLSVSDKMALVPEVESQTFLDPEAWYSQTEGVFTWILPDDVEAVAVEIATSTTNPPQLNEGTVYEPPIDEFAITPELLQEGVQYLNVTFKKETEWGITTNRKIKIDTTPPEKFTIKTESTASPSSYPAIITFETQDKVSGVAYYEILTPGQKPIKVNPETAKNGYQLKKPIDAPYMVKVVSYDKAGNKRESLRTISVTAGWTKSTSAQAENLFNGSKNLLIMVLLATLILLLLYIRYDKKRTKVREEKLCRETREIQEQMEKIFSALRDEIHEQINTITKTKRLSKKEKEAIEALAQSLEVSENLIEKEVNDVKTILK